MIPGPVARHSPTSLSNWMVYTEERQQLLFEQVGSFQMRPMANLRDSLYRANGVDSLACIGIAVLPYRRNVRAIDD